MSAKFDERQLRNVIFDVMSAMGEELQIGAQKNLDKDPIFGWTHNVNGMLAESITYTIDRSRDNPNVEIGTKLLYGKKLEYGTPKGTELDLLALIEWAELKFNDDEKTARLRAKLVVEDVYARGIPPYRFMFWSLQDMIKHNGQGIVSRGNKW